MITMNKAKFATVFIVAFVVGMISGGCASRTIESSSTKFSSISGKSFELTLPKELDAKNLVVTMDPASGVIKLTADEIRSSSQGVIQSAGAVQAETMNRLAGAAERALAVAASLTTGRAPPPAREPDPAPTPEPADEPLSPQPGKTR